MIVRHLLAAVLAGLVAGVLMTVVQQVKVVPLILQAEEYEGAGASSGDAHRHEAAGSPSLDSTAAQTSDASDTAHEHQHDHNGEGGILFGMSRFVATLGANIVAGGGFALLVAGVSLLSGKPVTIANGLAWGICGWLAVQFLPALGLPPELPGFPAADLAARQIWWIACVVFSTAGIGIVTLRPEVPARLIGLLLILAPHVWGVPKPQSLESAVPAVLASEFAVAALGSALVMWLSIGLLLGYLNARLEKAA